MMTQLRAITLERSGMRPLTFRGSLLARWDGEDSSERNRFRWHVLEVYRTQGGQYVLMVEYCTDWRGEVGHKEATVFDDPRDLATALEAVDPLAHFVGYPPGEQYEEKQQRERTRLVTAFRRGVSELFAGLGPEFVEAIE